MSFSGRRVRADYSGGELAKWVALFSRAIAGGTGDVLLAGGAVSRGVAALCSAEAVTLGEAVLFSRTAWTELERKTDAALLLLAHELVHVEQYRRLGMARFLFSYGGEYLAGRLKGLSHGQAYRDISFEKEARQGELFARRLLDTGALLRGVPESGRWPRT